MSNFYLRNGAFSRLKLSLTSAVTMEMFFLLFFICGRMTWMKNIEGTDFHHSGSAGAEFSHG